MKKAEVPQEKSFLKGYTRDVYYAKNNEGSYETALSSGWDIKHDALVATWEDIKSRAEKTLLEVKEGKLSPISYFMILKVMDISLLASYTGFRRWKIKRHLKPKYFNKLEDKKLQRYADAFDISLDELKLIHP